MTTPLPPNIGDTGWGTELNSYLENTVLAEANQTATSFSAHIAAAPAPVSPSDPHGDRAYALQLMAPFMQNVNLPNGFVQLDANGRPPGDTWHDLRPVTGMFGPNGQGQYPPQYRRTLEGEIRLAGYFTISNANYNGTSVFASPIPPAYCPAMPVDIPVTLSQAGTAASDGTPMLTIAANGYMSLTGLPAGLAAGTEVGIYGTYPLDAAYSLIQS